MCRDAGKTFVDVQGKGRVAIAADGKFGDGELVRILSRPEDIALLPTGDIGPNQVAGTIEHVGYMGDHLEYTIAAAGRTLILPATKKDRYPIGAEIRLAFDPACVTTLPQ